MKRKGIVLTVIVLIAVLAVSMTVFAVHNSSDKVFGKEFNKEMFEFEDYDELCQTDNYYYVYIPEKDMYAVTTSNEHWTYTTYLDKNGDACFTASDDGGETLYIDYPNDNEDAQLRNGETYEPIADINFGVWESAEIESEYNFTPQNKGNPRGSVLTEKDALKIQAITVIHEDSVRIFKEIIDE